MIVIYVLLLLTQDNSILLMERKNTKFGSGLYALVGGKVEKNEPALDAVVREAAEEIGIIVDKATLKLVHTFHRKGPESDLIALVFTTDRWVGEIRNNEPEKCSNVAWFDISKLPENMIPAHRQALELIQKGVHYSEHGWQ